MTEWHIPFDHILNHWSDEQLDVMVQKLTERKAREAACPPKVPEHRVSVDQLAKGSRNMVKVVDHYGD